MIRSIPADDLLSRLAEHSVGLALSDAISSRLDALVGVADASGAATSRKELVATLILSTPPDGDRLAKLVRDYRTARARDSLLHPDPSVSVLRFPTRNPALEAEALRPARERVPDDRSAEVGV